MPADTARCDRYGRSMAELRTRLAIRAVDDGLVLRGEIDGDTVADFDRALAESVAGGGIVRLHLQEVTSIDTEALRVLVAAAGRSRSRDGDVVLDGPTSEIASFVRASGLSWLLTMINIGANAAIPMSPPG